DPASGVQKITIQASGAQAMVATDVPGDSAQIVINKQGRTVLTYYATDFAGNAEAPITLIVKLDKIRPTTSGTPVVRLVQDRVIRDVQGDLNTIPVIVTGWHGTDALSGLDRYWLELSTNGGAFATLTAESLTATTTNRRLTPGSSYQ